MIQRFICAGSLNVDLIFPVARLPDEHEKLRCPETELAYGGAAANTAYWLARLGRPVTMLGCVGQDPFGASAVAELAAAGVDTSLIQRTERGPTGMAVVFSTADSKRMVTSGGANGLFDSGKVDAGLFGPGVHLHLATALREIAVPLARMAKDRGATVSCDLDESPDAQMLPYLDWVFMNHTELRRWTGSSDPSEGRRRLAPQTTLVVTQGAAGAVAVGPAGDTTVPAAAATVVDRTGGGDAFVAGFLHGLAQGLALQGCLRLGLSLAAEVIGAKGARPGGIDLTDMLRSAAENPPQQNAKAT